MKEYNLEDFSGQTIIWYEENAFRVSFTQDANSTEYQEYLASLEANEQETE
jgi:hypothetical protein